MRIVLATVNQGHLMTVQTQAERARGAAAAAQEFAKLPQLVGLHWFQYYDHPLGGRPDGEDYNFGLVDLDDRPYEALTEAFSSYQSTSGKSPSGGQTRVPGAAAWHARWRFPRQILIPMIAPSANGRRHGPWCPG